MAKKLPELGADVPWFGIPITEPVREWADDSSFPPSRELLHKHGLATVTSGKSVCWYCRNYKGERWEDAQSHLAGLSQDSKQHFTNVESFKHQTENLGERGWELNLEGITITKRGYTCVVCKVVGSWEKATEHLDSKNHKQKLAEMWTLERIATMKAQTPSQVKHMWASLFPRATLRPQEHTFC